MPAVGIVSVPIVVPVTEIVDECFMVVDEIVVDDVYLFVINLHTIFDRVRNF
jgi:hypothetical protein